MVDSKHKLETVFYIFLQRKLMIIFFSENVNYKIYSYLALETLKNIYSIQFILTEVHFKT